MARGAQVNPNRVGRPIVFWLGVALITFGAMLTLQEFLALRAEATFAYRLTPWMGVGLLLDAVGTALAGWGVLPRRLPDRSAVEALSVDDLVEPAASGLAAPEAELAAMDSAAMSRGHWGMFGRMYAGLVIDTMKPATLGFMLPGMQAEYGLSSTVVALFPMAAITGLTIGSVVFGMLGDLIGRRASFIFTALIFATTSVCGFMPDYPWHLLTCFVMGMAAGGELPLIYTMLAETMPARHRGWMGVAIGGIGGLSGYLVAGLLAAWLEPLYSWRMLWFANLPTAILMLAMLRWVPESPRFLLQMGFKEEAARAMSAGGALHDAHDPPPGERPGRLADLVAGRLRGVTATLCLFGFAWGVCNWGFITWLPVILRDLGLEAGFTSRLLAFSAFCAIPGTIVAAVAYGAWSSRWTAALAALATSGFLVAFGVLTPLLGARPDLILGLVIGLMITSNSMIGVLAPYSVEVYPTAVRGMGSGVVAASSKSGGIIAPMVVGSLLTLAASPAMAALVVAVPVGLAGLMMAARGIETRGRSLEELASDLGDGA